MKRGLSVLIAALMLLAAAAPAFAEAGAMAASAPKISFNQKIVQENGKNAVKVEVEITSSTSGAYIYYTTDGTNPTNSSEAYSDKNRPLFDESEDINIKAVAYQNSGSSGKSSVTAASRPGYNITVTSDWDKNDPNRNKTPESITIRFNGIGDKDTLYYTSDGSIPSDKNGVRRKKDTNGVKVTAATKLRYLVYREGCTSPTFIHNVTVQADNWLMYPDTGVENQYGGKLLVLEKPDGNPADSNIYYQTKSTTSSTAPTFPTLTVSNSTLYTGPIEFDTVGNHYVKFFAAGTGYGSSRQVTASVSLTKCSTPKITSSSATGGRKRVTITAGENEDIYFTRNGTAPNRSSELYTEPFYVDANCTISAVAMRQGYVNSEVKNLQITGITSTTTLAAPTLGAVMISPVGVRTIELLTDNPYATIRYNKSQTNSTVNRPTSSRPGTLYDGPIVFDKNGMWYFTAVTESGGKFGTADISKKTTVTLSSDADVTASLANGIKTVTFPDNTSGDIYYELRPGANNFLTAERIEAVEANRYVYPITVAETSSLSAVTVNDDGKRSVVYNANITISGGKKTPQKVAEPTVGYVSGGVTISCSDADADIFYVLDNAQNTVAKVTDTRYTGGTINTAGKAFVHVIAAKPGFTPATVTAPAEEQGDRTATPVITINSSGGGLYTAFITCATAGAKIYYTTDGAEPTTSSTPYSNFVPSLKATDVVKAIAVASGKLPSAVAVRPVSVTKVENILASVEDEYGGKSVMLETPTYGAYIYYTLDGSEPSAANGTLYDGGKIMITSAGTTTLKAVGTLSGCESSAVYSNSWTLEKLQKPTVAKSKTGDNVQFSYKGSEEGVEIYYTTDGTAPGAGSIKAPLAPDYVTFKEDVPALRVVAMKKGYVTSDEFVTDVTVPRMAVEVPNFAIDEYVLGGLTVNFTCSTEGAQIYYTYSKEIEPNIPYDGSPLLLSSPDQSIRVMAKKSGWNDSNVRRVSSSKMSVAAAPESGVETNSVVNLNSSVRLDAESYTNPVTKKSEKYTILYTLDGTDPTLDSDVYTAAVKVTGETEIRAAAAGIGVAMSPVRIFYYRVKGEDSGVNIDTSGLKNDGGLVFGSVKVTGARNMASSGTAVLAVYSGGALLKAMSAKMASTMTFDIPEEEGLETDGGNLTLKLFALDSFGTLEPLSKAEKRIY